MTSKRQLILIIFLITGLSKVYSQTDKELILELRNASNLALKTYDIEKILSFQTDDALTTTGSGTLLSGKDALKKYILANGPNKMYWVRKPNEIIVNENKGLAWETGIWNGYDPGIGSKSVVSGNYSAMWTKESGEWKIKSQLFVTLE